jgi:lipopolysaccharide export system permease protein
MTILDRYISQQIIRYFGATFTLVTVIYVIADFFEKVDNLIESGLSVPKAALYFLSRIPLEHLIPASTLLSVMVVYGLMNKHNEIIALKAGGISIYRLLKAPLFLGVFFSLVLLMFSEVLLPIVRSNANRIWMEEVEKVQVNAQRQNIWMKRQHAIYHIQFFDPVKMRTFDVSCYYFDKNFNMMRRIDAGEGEYRMGKWIFQDVMEQVRNAEDGSFTVQYHDKLAIPLSFEPMDLKRVVKNSDEMSLLELADYIQTAESEGYDATSFRVDWHAKVAYPLVCVILSIIAVSIAGRGRRGENFAIMVVTGIGLAFCFWVLQGFSLSLGYADMLPPLVAAWLPNVIYFFTAAVLLLRAE